MDQPRKEIQFFQLSQEGSVSPTLALTLSSYKDDTLTYKLERRNHKSISPVVLHNGKIKKGEWYTFVLKVNLHNVDFPKPGEITLWENSVPVFYKFDTVGYIPKRTINGISHGENFKVAFGPNREEDNTKVVMFFDEVRYAKNYYSAAPGTLLNPAKSEKVLFIGNSYTHREWNESHEHKGENLLPEMVAAAAASAGDQLNYDFRTQGGMSLTEHAKSTPIRNFKDNATETINKKGWDYIVLQEQSRIPSSGKKNEIEEYKIAVKNLVGTIKNSNPNATTLLYQSWGYRNGKEKNCDLTDHFECYKQMDDKNLASITEAANDNKIDISPVGSVIRYLREQDEEFIPYISDDSHLNDSGTFAAACTFYTIIFKKDPTLITFNGGLEQHVADAIKAATKTVVYDNLNKWTNDAVETGLQSFARMGVTDENLSMQVLLSPNPAKEYTQVTFSMPIKNCRLDVLNTVGEKFEVPYSFNGKTMDLDLSDLINGIYLIKLSSDNFQTIKKIIVEK